MLMLPTLPYFCAVTHLLPALRLPQTPKHDLDPEDEEEDEGPGGEYADGEGRPVPELWAHLQVSFRSPGTRTALWSPPCTLIVLLPLALLVRARLKAGCRPEISVFARTASSASDALLLPIDGSQKRSVTLLKARAMPDRFPLISSDAIWGLNSRFPAGLATFG